MSTRISKTTSKDFKIIDEKGEELDETEIFQAQWFRDFMRLSLESKFFGYSLIQFGDQVGDGFKGIKLVPREYVYPQKQAVRTTPQNTVDLIPFDRGKYKAWLIGVGRPDDIGILMKASPQVIYKKTAMGAWSEFTELFGSPFRFGKTNVREDDLRENMYEMLENMGRNAFGVFDTNDELEYIKDSQTDSYNVFNELIERTNSEISKLILGSTMTMDDGSSRSQSEVHERTTGAIEKEDAIFLSEVVNKQLIPWLNTYHGFNIQGKWVFDETENIPKAEQFKMDIELVKNGFNVPKEYFTETYGTPIDEKEEVEESPKGPKELDAENVLKKKAFSLENYENFIGAHNCDICNTIDLSETPEPTWDEAFINEIIAGVHAGTYTLTNLPESLYLETADRLVKSMLEGVAESKVIPTIADPDFIRAMRNNAYIFSGAKTFQEVKTMSDFLLDENGELRSFADFKKKAAVTFDQFNKHWLRTEMTQAHNTAEAASKWQQFEAEKDVFPYLRYDTAGDQRVRESHKLLDGIIKPVDDPFWDTHAAPNGWNCRCELLQESEAVPTADEDITLPDDIPESMQFNPGKQKVLFSPEHPYFVVDDQFSELRDNNFNLPDPPENG
jgi:SPP1 gp7 family putative phage head morphogenesis protein